MPEPRPTMPSFLRKQKPRPVSTSPPQPPRNLSQPPRAILNPPDPFPSAAVSPSPQRPRKRYRKKVNGLFAEHKELKKRMAKLLRPVCIHDLLEAPLSCRSPNKVKPQNNRGKNRFVLPPPDAILSKLAVQTNHKQYQDDFDFPPFVERATAVLGSDKLNQIRATVGRLCPYSNQLFIDKMNLHVPTPAPINPFAITPPRLPAISATLKSMHSQTFPVAVERTATPAKLRRNARRIEKGYRCEEVLKARLKAAARAAKRREEDIIHIPTPRRRHVRANRRDARTTPPKRPRPVVSNPFQLLVEAAAKQQPNIRRIDSLDSHDREARRKKRRTE